MEDIVLLLEELQILAIEEPRTIIGRLTFGLDKEEIQMQIAKIRSSLPSEIKSASQNVRQSEEIKRTAQEHAEQILEAAKKEALRLVDQANAQSLHIIESAQNQQSHMVADSEILKLTKAQCEELRNDAERTAHQIRKGAEQYAGDLLARLEANIDRVANSVKSSRAELGSIEISPVNTANRPVERIRV